MFAFSVTRPTPSSKYFGTEVERERGKQRGNSAGNTAREPKGAPASGPEASAGNTARAERRAGVSLLAPGPARAPPPAGDGQVELGHQAVSELPARGRAAEVVHPGKQDRHLAPAHFDPGAR
jgi:hypothetical protein